MPTQPIEKVYVNDAELYLDLVAQKTTFIDMGIQQIGMDDKIMSYFKD